MGSILAPRNNHWGKGEGGTEQSFFLFCSAMNAEGEKLHLSCSQALAEAIPLPHTLLGKASTKPLPEQESKDTTGNFQMKDPVS